MIEMIQLLEQKGIAYQAEDRSVYFRLSKFPELRAARALESGRAAADRAHPE